MFINNKKLFLIAGPCVMESYENMAEIAGYIKSLSEKYDINFIFKASFEKANRSSISSYTGVGIKKGLEWLKKIKNEFGLPVLTDIHTPDQAEEVGKVVDIIQIPAFLCRQTELLLEAGKTGKVVNIKKGQFLSPTELKNAAEKVKSTGNNEIMLTERGTFFGYNNLVVDYRGFAEMSETEYPVIFDATHSLQKPAVHGNKSGGQPELVLPMSMAAVATGFVDGLFIETHPSPKDALSDAAAMLPLSELENVLQKVLKIYNTVKDLNG